MLNVILDLYFCFETENCLFKACRTVNKLHKCWLKSTKICLICIWQQAYQSTSQIHFFNFYRSFDRNFTTKKFPCEKREFQSWYRNSGVTKTLQLSLFLPKVFFQNVSLKNFNYFLIQHASQFNISKLWKGYSFSDVFYPSEISNCMQ